MKIGSFSAERKECINHDRKLLTRFFEERKVISSMIISQYKFKDTGTAMNDPMNI